MRPTIHLAPNGDFVLTFQGGNELRFPNNPRGCACMTRVLQAREESKTKIGLEGNPTQYIIEQWLRHNTPTRSTFTLDLEGIDL